MTDDKAVGLTFSAETVFPDGERVRVEVATNHWDANGDAVGELLRDLLAGMGFAEKTIADIFGDDCDCYREMDDESGPGYEVTAAPPQFASASPYLEGSWHVADEPHRSFHQECNDSI